MYTCTKNEMAACVSGYTYLIDASLTKYLLNPLKQTKEPTSRDRIASPGAECHRGHGRGLHCSLVDWIDSISTRGAGGSS